MTCTSAITQHACQSAQRCAVRCSKDLKEKIYELLAVRLHISNQSKRHFMDFSIDESKLERNSLEELLLECFPAKISLAKSSSSCSTSHSPSSPESCPVANCLKRISDELVPLRELTTRRKSKKAPSIPVKHQAGADVVVGLSWDYFQVCQARALKWM